MQDFISSQFMNFEDPMRAPLGLASALMNLVSACWNMITIVSEAYLDDADDIVYEENQYLPIHSLTTNTFVEAGKFDKSTEKESSTKINIPDEFSDGYHLEILFGEPEMLTAGQDQPADKFYQQSAIPIPIPMSIIDDPFTDGYHLNTLFQEQTQFWAPRATLKGIVELEEPTDSEQDDASNEPELLFKFSMQDPADFEDGYFLNLLFGESIAEPASNISSESSSAFVSSGSTLIGSTSSLKPLGSKETTSKFKNFFTKTFKTNSQKKNRVSSDLKAGASNSTKSCPWLDTSARKGLGHGMVYRAKSSMSRLFKSGK